MWKCKNCDVTTNSNAYEGWCLGCEDFTMEKQKLDTEKTKVSFGKEHPVNCPNSCGELEVGHASDVNFGNTTRDIYLIFCPKCNYEDSVFTS